MGDEQKLELLLAFFKALSDETRLQIVALLMKHPHTVEQIAEILGLTAPTISHHLKRLTAAGLVQAAAQQYYHVYSLRPDVLREMASKILDGAIIEEAALPTDSSSYDRKVLGDYIVDGKLKIIPSQRKKRDVVLRYLVEQFEPDRRYSETEINMVLARFHEDVATLRREFIMMKMMERESGVYWRV